MKTTALLLIYKTKMTAITFNFYIIHWLITFNLAGDIFYKFRYLRGMIMKLFQVHENMLRVLASHS